MATEAYRLLVLRVIAQVGSPVTLEALAKLLTLPDGCVDCTMVKLKPVVQELITSNQVRIFPLEENHTRSAHEELFYLAS